MIVENRVRAIFYAVCVKRQQDIVAGKGHENYQIIGDRKLSCLPDVHVVQ